jgi:hypothetical protein
MTFRGDSEQFCPGENKVTEKTLSKIVPTAWPIIFSLSFKEMRESPVALKLNNRALSEYLPFFLRLF